MASTRLPGKPLADIAGSPMIVHVMRAAMAANAGPVWVACAEAEIKSAVEAAGGRAVLTDPTLMWSKLWRRHLAARFILRGRQPPAAKGAWITISAFMPIAGARLRPFALCRHPRLSSASVLSNCAPLRPACIFTSKRCRFPPTA